MSEALGTAGDPASRLRRVTRDAEVDRTGLGDLSDFFNPFLPHFMKEALRCGGEVQISMGDGTVDGILLYHDAEKTASIFTRDPTIARTLFELRTQVSVFSDFALSPVSETYGVYEIDVAREPGCHRYAHPVRAAGTADLPAILALMKEVYGRVDERWIETVSPTQETCFVVDGADALAGAAWATTVGGWGRLHSLSVRSRYRRMGVATDLWHVRMEWMRRVGVSRVLTEISDLNVLSRRIAEAGGMRRRGEIHLSRRA
jgi:GNAT superfamily N-acetyltransferase